MVEQLTVILSHLTLLQHFLMYFLWTAALLTIISWSPLTGELQEWGNPPVSETRPSWKRLWAKVSAPGEGGREREGHSSSVRLPEGEAPVPQRWTVRPDERPQAHHVEPGVQERRGLELWEVPGGAGRRTVQTLQQEVPDQRHRGRHQEAPEPGKLNSPSCSSLHTCCASSTQCLCSVFYCVKVSSESSSHVRGASDGCRSWTSQLHWVELKHCCGVERSRAINVCVFQSSVCVWLSFMCLFDQSQLRTRTKQRQVRRWSLTCSHNSLWFWSGCTWLHHKAWLHHRGEGRSAAQVRLNQSSSDAISPNTDQRVEASSLYCTLNSNISQLKTNTVDIGNKINIRDRNLYTYLK